MSDLDVLARAIAEPLIERIQQQLARNSEIVSLIYSEIDGTQAIVKDLRLWRENSKKRLKRGLGPKLFASDVLPEVIVIQVWSRLREADSTGAIDRAFLPVLANPKVAGLAVKAFETGRVLLIQRATDPDDPASGKWEFPGGHLETGETSFDGACREWSEETGCSLPDGDVVGSWLSPDGVYECWVYVIPFEDLVPNNPDPENRSVLNPDDPDSDNIEVFAWFDPQDMRGNPAMRTELSTTDWDVLQFAGEFQRFNPNHGEGGRFVEGWNHNWTPGEHGGKSFTTATANVDVVNPQPVPGERIFVGGSRGVNDRIGIEAKLSELPQTSTVLTSRTYGASAAVRDVALNQGRSMEVWTARMDQFPTKEAAYFARDEEMIRSSNRIVEFYDGKSPGTTHEIEYARSIGKPVEVISVVKRYNPNHDEKGEFASGSGSLLGKGQGRGSHTNIINPVTGEPMTKTGVGKLGAKVFQEKVAPDLERRLGGKMQYLSAGDQERAPLDFKFGERTGVELKTISITSGSQKVAMSLDEIGRKEDALHDLGLKQGATILQVLDVANARCDVYYTKGFRSMNKAGMEKIGTYSIKSQLRGG